MKANTIPTPYRARVGWLRARLEAADCDAALVLNRMDQFWLTGFTGEDGAVAVTRRAVVLLTDGRFDETAAREAPWARKVLRVVRGAESIAEQLRALRARRVAFDPGHMHVALHGELRKLLRPAQLRLTPGLLLEARRCKDAGEVSCVRRAVDVAQNAYAKMLEWVEPGMRERDVAARLVYEMQLGGAQGAAFAPIVASGPNASLPHYESGDRKLRANEGFLLDWGARVGWYVSDLTRMVWLGSIPPKLPRAYAAVRAAHDEAIRAIRPGASADAVDGVARSCLEKLGLGERFTHALGHGLGLDVHESPRLGRKSKDVLQSGMVVTVEPGVYLPGVGGVRLESDVLVCEGGCEVLSSLPL